MAVPHGGIDDDVPGLNPFFQNRMGKGQNRFQDHFSSPESVVDLGNGLPESSPNLTFYQFSPEKSFRLKERVFRDGPFGRGRPLNGFAHVSGFEKGKVLRSAGKPVRAVFFTVWVIRVIFPKHVEQSKTDVGHPDR